jgi:hypothetical protein
MDEVWNLLDYPDDDVKAAAIEATSFFLIAYFKSGVGRYYPCYPGLAISSENCLYEDWVTSF